MIESVDKIDKFGDDNKVIRSEVDARLVRGGHRNRLQIAFLLQS